MINKCLFPAAGYGTRFLPATKAIPKEMLPILNKPLLQYGVEEAMSAGIENMAIVTGRGKRAIEDHFDNSFELEQQLRGTSKEYLLDEIKHIIDNATFTYVRQKKMLGLGHAILSAESLVGNEPFAVILADDLCDCEQSGVTKQLIDIYNEYQCSVVAIEEISIDEIKNYGVVTGEFIDGNSNTLMVNKMIEKPNSLDLFELEKRVKKGDEIFHAIIGRYILTPEIFQILRNTKPGKNGEIQITDALMNQARKGKVLAHKFKGKRFDCGSVKGFYEANQYFSKYIK